jgi:hypothetical protein
MVFSVAADEQDTLMVHARYTVIFRKLRTACVFGGLLALGCGWGPSADVPGNLVRNGGFERADPEGTAIHWLYGTPPGEKAEFQLISVEPKAGTHCLRIKGAGAWAAAVAMPRISIDRSKTYTLRGWVRVHAGRGLIKFDYFNGERHVGQTWSRVVEAGGGWTELTVQSQAASFPDATHLVATVAGLGMHECDFDEISMRAH